MPQDKGELEISLTIVEARGVRTLIVDFGQEPVKWIGLDKKTALGLAEKLQALAEEL